MKTFFVEKNNFDNNLITVMGDEHNHLKNVLRLCVHDKVKVVCGDEFDYFCEITEIAKNSSTLQIINKDLNKANPKVKLTAFVALIKNEHLNLIIQKLTELGVSEIVPFESRYTVVKDNKNKSDKLQTISNQSVKQCGRSMPVKVNATVNINKINLNNFDKVIFANESEKDVPLDFIFNDKIEYKEVAIIIGPEGGFTEEEKSFLIKSGATSVSLGARILRAETAAIMLTTIILYNLGEYK